MTSEMSFLRLLGSPRARFAFNAISGLLVVGVGIVTTRHFIAHGWPLHHANVLGVIGAGALFLAAFAFKAWGWQRLFNAEDRPRTLTLAAAGGAATVTGVALPGRFDELVRIAVVRKLPGKRCTVKKVCLSLFILGLVDNAALMVRFNFDGPPSGWTLTWPGAGTLQSTTNITTPVNWNPVPSSHSPYYIRPNDAPMIFYRAVGQ